MNFAQCKNRPFSDWLEEVTDVLCGAGQPLDDGDRKAFLEVFIDRCLYLVRSVPQGGICDELEFLVRFFGRRDAVKHIDPRLLEALRAHVGTLQVAVEADSPHAVPSLLRESDEHAKNIFNLLGSFGEGGWLYLRRLHHHRRTRGFGSSQTRFILSDLVRLGLVTVSGNDPDASFAKVALTENGRKWVDWKDSLVR